MSLEETNVWEVHPPVDPYMLVERWRKQAGQRTIEEGRILDECADELDQFLQALGYVSSTLPGES